jgi:arabinogalactan oligomer/maltooligosaccharide transport system permease protein
MDENVKNKRHMGMKLKNNITNTIVYAILIVISIIWLVPFVFILLESFRVESSMPVGYVIPHEWGFDNYIKLFAETDFPIWYLNTFLIGLAVAVLQTVIVLAMSYTLSRLRFKGRKFLMNFMLILGMFPGFLSMIAVLFILKLIGLNASILGLVIIYAAGSAMGYYISKGFFDTIPKSLDEAVLIDGGTKNTVFWKIIIPLSKPIIVYTV